MLVNAQLAFSFIQLRTLTHGIRRQTSRQSPLGWRHTHGPTQRYVSTVIPNPPSGQWRLNHHNCQEEEECIVALGTG